jgi:hypothetical protein
LDSGVAFVAVNVGPVLHTDRAVQVVAVDAFENVDNRRLPGEQRFFAVPALG